MKTKKQINLLIKTLLYLQGLPFTHRNPQLEISIQKMVWKLDGGKPPAKPKRTMES